MSAEITLVLGGAKSGKSEFAENLVLKSKLNPVYLATGRAFDDEMVSRIESHQDRRGTNWKTVEEPLALVDALHDASFQKNMILVDCLTLWITNLMMADAKVHRETKTLCEFLKKSEVPIVLVSNEVGQGVIPDNKMAREFIDLAGFVHQQVASICDNVYMVTAGLPQKLK